MVTFFGSASNLRGAPLLYETGGGSCDLMIDTSRLAPADLQRILDAAAELFYRDGINATGVERLAHEPGILPHEQSAIGAV